MKFLSEPLGVANGAIIPKLGLVMSYVLLGLYVLMSIISLPRLRATVTDTEALDRNQAVESLPHALSDV